MVFANFLIAMAMAFGPSPQDVIQQNREPVKADAPDKRPIETKSRGYVSSDNCRQCHELHYDTWHASHHRTMTQVPTKESVIADFDNKVLIRSGHEFRFFQKDHEYFMELKKIQPKSDDKSSAKQTFKIVLMTGAHHQQAFWCETDQARTLRTCLLYTSPSPRDATLSRMPSSA